MISITKTFVAGSAFLLVAGAAFSQDSFTTAFTFAPDAPVEEIYEQFEDSARKACRADRGISVGTRVKMESACRDSLMANAVKAANLYELETLYAERTGTPQSAIILADDTEAGSQQ